MNAPANILMPSLPGATRDPGADDGCEAIAIGRLVDARIRQLRQLCGARLAAELDRWQTTQSPGANASRTFPGMPLAVPT